MTHHHHQPGSAIVFEWKFYQCPQYASWDVEAQYPTLRWTRQARNELETALREQIPAIANDETFFNGQELSIQKSEDSQEWPDILRQVEVIIVERLNRAPRDRFPPITDVFRSADSRYRLVIWKSAFETAEDPLWRSFRLIGFHDAQEDGWEFHTMEPEVYRDGGTTIFTRLYGDPHRVWAAISVPKLKEAVYLKDHDSDPRTGFWENDFWSALKDASVRKGGVILRTVGADARSIRDEFTRHAIDAGHLVQ